MWMWWKKAEDMDTLTFTSQKLAKTSLHWARSLHCSLHTYKKTSQKCPLNIKTLLHRCRCLSITEWNATGQSRALRLSPGRTVAFHDAVIQQMARASIGKRSTFKLYCTCLMNEAVGTQNTADRDIAEWCQYAYFWTRVWKLCLMQDNRNKLVAQTVALPVSVGQKVPGGWRRCWDLGSVGCHRTLTAAQRRCWRFLTCKQEQNKNMFILISQHAKLETPQGHAAQFKQTHRQDPLWRHLLVACWCLAQSSVTI